MGKDVSNTSSEGGISMNENKQEILNLLKKAVVKTVAGQDIIDLSYHPDLERVIITYNHGYEKSVNVAMDSGIAMIRDVLREIN